MPVNFNGQVLIQPQARTAFNYAGLTPPNPATPHQTVLIGESNQGPNALTLIQSGSDILNNLGQDSDGANACWLALNPSGETNGANPLYFWNVNPTTQGTIALLDTAAATQITATTTRWGQAANQISLSIATGSVSGYTVTTADGYSGQSITQSNVSLDVLTLAYSGTYTGVSASVTDSALTVSGTASGATSATTLTTVSFATYPTVQQVVNQLNQTAGMQAVVTDPNPLQASAALFDNVTDVAITTAAVTFTANVAAVVAALNSGAQPWLTAVRSANATSLAVTAQPVYATGGTTGVAATSDWQSAYTALQAQHDVLWVTPISESEAIWSMNDQHCRYMHSLGYGRSGVVGGASGTTVSVALSNAGFLVSQYTAYLVNGFSGAAFNGTMATFPPYVAVAALTAMEAGQPLNEALTMKALHATGLEQTFAVPVVDQLIQGGCVVLKEYHGTYVVAKGQTTAVLDPSATSDQIQMSAVNERFVVEAGMNAVLTAFIGQPITPLTPALVQDAVLTYLASVAQNPGALIFQAPTRSQITVKVSGTVISVTAPASPTLPADYALALLTVSQDTAVAA